MTLNIINQVEESGDTKSILPILKDETHIQTGKASSGSYHWAPGAIYENPNLKNED